MSLGETEMWNHEDTKTLSFFDIAPSLRACPTEGVLVCDVHIEDGPTGNGKGRFWRES